ncbi:MAG: hypothetical protein JKY22_11005 [Flavobacteriaceae bacterium]|nr:hypothetical protein [Flavobacteriaceae bacterium]
MKNSNYNFVQWSSPEELHEDCLQWISKLKFIKDEQGFLNDLIKNHTLEMLSEDLYKSATHFISQLQKEEKEVEKLLQKVENHCKGLKILLDGIDEIREEKSYKEVHYYRKMEVTLFEQEYQKTKKEIFNLIKNIMRKDSMKLLTE